MINSVSPNKNNFKSALYGPIKYKYYIFLSFSSCVYFSEIKSLHVTFRGPNDLK